LLQVEAALAKVQGVLGVIPASAAAQISTGIEQLSVDFAALQVGLENDGFPIIDLVRQIRAQVGGEAGAYVHWGATTQDIMDTAFILQARAALHQMSSSLQQIII